MIRRAFLRGVAILLAATIFQLATVAAIAAIGSSYVPKDPEVSSARLLIDSVRLDEEHPIVMYSIDGDWPYRQCGMQRGDLGPDDDNFLKLDHWTAYSALLWLSGNQKATRDRWLGLDLEQRLVDRTTEFDRRFLVGCMNGTVLAPICHARASSLVKAADEAKISAQMDQRLQKLEKWDLQTICTFMRGAKSASERKAT